MYYILAVPRAAHTWVWRVWGENHLLPSWCYCAATAENGRIVASGWGLAGVTQKLMLWTLTVVLASTPIYRREWKWDKKNLNKLPEWKNVTYLKQNWTFLVHVSPQRYIFINQTNRLFLPAWNSSNIVIKLLQSCQKSVIPAGIQANSLNSSYDSSP